MFYGTIVTLLTLAMAFGTIATTLPVPATESVAEAKRAALVIEIRELVRFFELLHFNHSLTSTRVP